MQSLKKQFNENGFVVLRNFFTQDDIEPLYREARQTFAIQIKRVLGKPVNIDERDIFEAAMFEFFNTDFDAFVGTGKNVQHSIALYRLNTDERLIAILKELGLSNPNIGVRPSMQFNSRFLSKGGTHWRLGAHQDWRTGQGSLDSIVMWFPLVPCNHELGVLQVVPKSHIDGLLEATGVSYEGALAKDYPDDQYVETEINPGDLLIFSAMLVHRSGNNITNNIRWSVQYRFNNLDEPTFIERGYPQAYIYKPQEELLTPNFPTSQQLEALYFS